MPADRAKKTAADPRAALKRHANYFDTFNDIRIANICGSCGKKAVPLAVLGADATVFDISKDNKRYALELADAAGVEIDVAAFGVTFYICGKPEFLGMSNHLLFVGENWDCVLSLLNFSILF